MHNPITGSGGMLIGRVREVGPEHPARGKLAPGDRIATLVSLTLTPLRLDEVGAPSGDQVEAKGHAILFATGLWAKLPEDLPERLALSVLDVCGAPALAARLCRPGMRVLVLGAGKSGALVCAQAMRSVMPGGAVIALDVRAPAVVRLRAAGLCTAAVTADATHALEVMNAVKSLTGGALCDLVVNCASVSGTELGSILSARDGGTVLFFSMATSFTAAALGAEGVGKDATLLVGNGYVPGHAELALELVRATPALRGLLLPSEA
jgi:L-erythro-3,5-diaminohexanoate dehydrogenase